jgi:hypothetical protein
MYILKFSLTPKLPFSYLIKNVAKKSVSHFTKTLTQRYNRNLDLSVRFLLQYQHVNDF